MYRIESSTSENLGVTITAPVDPTSYTLEFAVSTTTDLSSASWEAGTWDGSWNDNEDSPEAGQIAASTPLIGDGETLDISQGGKYYLYFRVDTGTQTPVRLIDFLDVR